MGLVDPGEDGDCLLPTSRRRTACPRQGVRSRRPRTAYHSGQGRPSRSQSMRSNVCCMSKAWNTTNGTWWAPRLISELQGPAKRLVIGKKPDWVSFPGGVQVLLNTLRASLGKPQVSEMADYLTKYFHQTRRKSQGVHVGLHHPEV